MEKRSDALKVAMVAILTAVVVVFTMIVKIPTAKGYLNLCDVAVCFIAFTFGPWTALISAGLGSALADLISGYAQWAPISFVCHGLEGLLVALIALERVDRKIGWFRKICAALVSLVCVAGGYYVLSGLFISGFTVALAEVPWNLVQSGVGVALGLAVSRAVKKAYPPVRSLTW